MEDTAPPCPWNPLRDDPESSTLVAGRRGHEARARGWQGPAAGRPSSSCCVRPIAHTPPFLAPVTRASGTVAECVEDLCGNAEARVLLVPATEGTEVGVRVGRQHRQLIEQRDLVGVESRARGRLSSPHVPGQHLHLVEGGEFSNQASRNEPEAIEVDERDPKPGGIDLAATAAMPGDGRCHELVSRDVERIERDAQPLPPDVVELRVDQDPPIGILVPVLADPVIFKLRGIEVAAEPASRAPGSPWT
jgi:hypothetical protein